jgi:hypothetical protein
MASEAAVIPRRNTLSIVATKEALTFCNQQDRKSDLCEEMRKATQMIRHVALIPAARSVAAVSQHRDIVRRALERRR